jgi:hypothetical protein
MIIFLSLLAPYDIQNLSNGLYLILFPITEHVSFIKLYKYLTMGAIFLAIA